MREQVADTSGAEVYVAGPAGILADFVVAFAGIDGILLVTAAVVVLLILLIVYRSPVLPFPGAPQRAARAGRRRSVVYFLADNDIITLNGQSQGILFDPSWVARPPTTPCCSRHDSARSCARTGIALPRCGSPCGSLSRRSSRRAAPSSSASCACSSASSTPTAASVRSLLSGSLLAAGRAHILARCSGAPRPGRLLAFRPAYGSPASGDHRSLGPRGAAGGASCSTAVDRHRAVVLAFAAFAPTLDADGLSGDRAVPPAGGVGRGSGRAVAALLRRGRKPGRGHCKRGRCR